MHRNKNLTGECNIHSLAQTITFHNNNVHRSQPSLIWINKTSVTTNHGFLLNHPHHFFSQVQQWNPHKKSTPTCHSLTEPLYATQPLTWCIHLQFYFCLDTSQKRHCYVSLLPQGGEGVISPLNLKMGKCGFKTDIPEADASSRRQECSCRFWLGDAVLRTQRSRWCCESPAPSAWHRSRRRRTGTGAWKSSSSASPAQHSQENISWKKAFLSSPFLGEVLKKKRVEKQQ